MGNWSEEINSKIDVDLEKSREKDIRFFRVEEFKRNITRVDDFSTSCPFCLKQKIDIAEISSKIEEAIEVPGNSRRNYDRLISRLSKHMQKEHGFFPPFHFSYLYSFIGILTGSVIGYLLYKFLPEHGPALFSACFVIGIITAYFAGARKDNQVRTAKKIM
jgi:F0F1-type ATP synthase assembly protein I